MRSRDDGGALQDGEARKSREGATATSTSSSVVKSGQLGEVERQLRKQHMQLVQQGQTTARAVAAAAGDDGDNTTDATVGADEEARLRQQAVELARRAFLAEQQRQVLVQSSNRVSETSLDDSIEDLMSPDDVVSAREMTAEDIREQLVQKTSVTTTTTTTSAPPGDPISHLSPAADTAPTNDGQQSPPVRVLEDPNAALRERQARVSTAVQRLRAAAAAGGARSPAHTAVLEQHGVVGSAVHTRALCHVEALARTTAHAHLADQRCGATKNVSAQPESMLITF